MTKSKLLVLLQPTRSSPVRVAALAVMLLVAGDGRAQSVATGPGVTIPGGDTLLSLTRFSDAQTRRVSSTNPDINSNGDSRVIKEGETLVFAELTGPGAITHLWNTIASQDPFAGRSLVLRIYWDGMARPSVEVPLGDFFGVGHGASVNFTSLPVTVSSYGRSRTCFWRMPFRKSAKITFTNEPRGFGDIEVYYYVDWEKLPSLPEDSLYFHARYHQAFLDGKPVGPELDLCNQGEDWTWYGFDLHDLAAGKHTLKFAGRGASPKQRSKAAAQFAFGLNSLVLLRLDDMAEYK